MQVNRVTTRRIRLAIVLITLSSLLMAAVVLLYISVGFGFAAGEIMANPNAVPDANSALKRAANLSLALAVAVLLLFAAVVVRAGLLKAELHWTLRGSGALVVGGLLSYLGTYAILAIGGLPRPLVDVVGALANWIQQHVYV